MHHKSLNLSLYVTNSRAVTFLKVKFNALEDIICLNAALAVHN